MNGTRRRCVDKIDQDRNGTPIWDLCKMVEYIFQDHPYWIPRSGKQIKVWKDDLGPTSPTNFLQVFSELKQ